ncbi:MAG: deoxyribodipyrimidine photo-lyase [Gemmatimonadota bacterium]|nr:deoxyribodipyrimidine photo-lyase [Gemmatimonadota bacterium]
MPPSPAPTLVWFRADLRVADNPALIAAIARGAPVVPVFVWSATDEGVWPHGAATRWWLHHSLERLDAALQARGARLIIRAGSAAEIIPALAAECRASAVVWTRRYEPAAEATSRSVAATLRRNGIEAHELRGNLLLEPEEISTKDGRPFQVFTPFWTALQRRPGSIALAIRAPRSIPAPTRWAGSDSLESLSLRPTLKWAQGLRASWVPGEAGARAAMKAFANHIVGRYSTGRDVPSDEGTSRLSPYLHFGEISARQAWYASLATGGSRVTGSSTGAAAFRRQLAWRDFAHHLLVHFPKTDSHPLREQFSAFPWRRDARALTAWQRGETGFPIVDAGMRELWHTGWMHNRVRMIAASFLVKHLLIRWQEGARWFWDTLVDADLANNTLGWQWTAGCGADAAPYFRVFNPTLQAQRFDARGAYVRRWVPELAQLPDALIHQPWTATPIELAAAGIELGVHYPRPIVDHAAARSRALAAYEVIRRTAVPS